MLLPTASPPHLDNTLRVITVSNIANRSFKTFLKDQQYVHDLWQCDLNINKVHLLKRHSLYQVWHLFIKGVKKYFFYRRRNRLVHRLTNRQTYRQVQNNMPPLCKEGHKTRIVCKLNSKSFTSIGYSYYVINYSNKNLFNSTYVFWPQSSPGPTTLLHVYLT